MGVLDPKAFLFIILSVVSWVAFDYEYASSQVQFIKVFYIRTVKRIGHNRPFK